MSELEIPDAATYAASEPIEAAYAEPVQRDAEDLADDVLRAGGPALVAAELRSMADSLEVRRAEMREEDDRTVRAAGLGEGIRRLRERADELDPSGGQR